MLEQALLNAQNYFDVIILGGGAAGLFAAATAGQRGRRVLVLERSNKIGKKILMSGGGRCNFTNLEVSAEHFLCDNPHFVKSALAQYTQWDFIALVAQYGIEYHEKTLGQLFCDHSAKDIVNMLKAECDKGHVLIKTLAETHSVDKRQENYQLSTSIGEFSCQSLIVATGGLSVPTLGGSGFGYQLADQFGLKVNTTEASLVPLTLTGALLELSNNLAGVSQPIAVSVPTKNFQESMLFTHRGLSGPAILQISNYWQLGETIFIDLAPMIDLEHQLLEAKQNNPTSKLATLLSQVLAKSLVNALLNYWWPELVKSSLQELKNSQCKDIAKQLHQWQIKPSGTEGYRTAEVTRGGVDMDSISSKTMQHKTLNGLFFIGEVLDVTGHLGGYNFQWAWSSGYVAGIHA